MMKKILAGIMAIIALAHFAGCGGGGKHNAAYNAVVLSGGYTFVDSFLNENRTYGTFYLNEDFSEEEDDWSDRYLVDKTSPAFRTYIIKEQTELDKIFKDFRQIDFDKEMVLLYCYSENYNRPQIINDIKLDGTVLKVDFSLKKPKEGNFDFAFTQTSFLIIKLNLLTVTEVNFNKK